MTEIGKIIDGRCDSHTCYQRPDGNYVVQSKTRGRSKWYSIYFILSPEQWHNYLTDDITHFLVGVGLRSVRTRKKAATELPREKK